MRRRSCWPTSPRGAWTTTTPVSSWPSCEGSAGSAGHQLFWSHTDPKPRRRPTASCACAADVSRRHEETRMTRRVALYTLCAVLLLMAGPAAPQPNDRTRVFNAPVDRVWVVARSTLKGLGWDVDKEDREVGWIRTDSRRLEGEDYGVYSKGAKHRLRLVIKAQDASRTTVTV